MIGAMQATLARACRRAALPLGWYYVVTLGLPLANGAAESGAVLLNHALVVLVVPPILIMIVCTIRKTAQVIRYPLISCRRSGRGR